MLKIQLTKKKYENLIKVVGTCNFQKRLQTKFAEEIKKNPRSIKNHHRGNFMWYLQESLTPNDFVISFVDLLFILASFECFSKNNENIIKSCIDLQKLYVDFLNIYNQYKGEKEDEFC